MRKFLFIFIYILFIFCQLVYGSWHIIGPITPRHIMSVVVLLLCVREQGLKFDKYFVLYGLFIGCFLLAGALSDNMIDAINWSLAFYFVSYVAYESTKIVVCKYEGINYLVYSLLFVGILDSLFTIGQMYMIPFVSEVSNYLHFNREDELMAYVADTNRASMGGFAVPGIVGNVANGYLISSMCILCLYSQDSKLHVSNVLLWLFFEFTLIIIQERTALVVGTVLSFYAIFKLFRFEASKSTSRVPILIVILILIIFSLNLSELNQLAFSDNSRYEHGFDYGEERGHIASQVWEFFVKNPLGGYFKYKELAAYPHNVFLNALVFGGLFGTIAIIVLLFKHLAKVIRVVFSKFQNTNANAIFIFALMFICFNANSLTHNASLVSGDASYWVYWGVVISLININNRIQLA